MKNILIFVTALGLVACGGESVTTPDVSLPQQSVVQPQAANPEAPAAEPEEDASNGRAPSATVNPDGSVTFNNETYHSSGKDICYFKKGPHPQQLLYTYDGNFAASSVTNVPFPKEVTAPECGSIEIQIDVVNDGACGSPSNALPGLLAWGYVTLTDEGEWIEQEAVRENEGEWGECHQLDVSSSTWGHKPKCEPEKIEGVKERTYDRVVYSTNSCASSKELREVSRTTLTETEKCSFTTERKQCDTAICHTENKQYCDIFGNCKKKQDGWFLFKKWQCQNIPPGVPGHYDNHFDHPQHDDYFGECNVVKCYEIRN